MRMHTMIMTMVMVGEGVVVVVVGFREEEEEQGEEEEEEEVVAVVEVVVVMNALSVESSVIGLGSVRLVMEAEMVAGFHHLDLVVVVVTDTVAPHKPMVAGMVGMLIDMVMIWIDMVVVVVAVTVLEDVMLLAEAGMVIMDLAGVVVVVMVEEVLAIVEALGTDPAHMDGPLDIQLLTMIGTKTSWKKIDERFYGYFAGDSSGRE